MEELRRVSIELYEHAAAHAEARGIILADTKFEFGASPGAEVVLGDEVFTPDSSRFWPADEYEPGRSQRSFDKQYLRDWLDQIGWDHTPPAPELPDEVVANTRAKYLEAYERITGERSTRRPLRLSLPPSTLDWREVAVCATFSHSAARRDRAQSS